MATAHPLPTPAHGGAGAHGAHGDAEHPVFIQHKHPNYVGIFFVLLAFTIIEVWITTPFFGISFAGIFGEFLVIPMLIIFAVLKFATIAMFYMHLRFDSIYFTILFAVGLILALGMWLTLQGLFLAHHRVPFDEVAARKEGILSAGPHAEKGASETGGGTGSATGTTGTTGAR